jgi:glycine cleavage system H protein
MATVKYTEDHEYISVEGDIGTIGITDYAQSQLGDVVFIELPEPGKVLAKGAEAAVVESVKAASEVFSPVSGTIVEVNSDLPESPATVNEDPQGKGWFIKVKLADLKELDGLMDEAAYKSHVGA